MSSIRALCRALTLLSAGLSASPGHALEVTVSRDMFNRRLFSQTVTETFEAAQVDANGGSLGTGNFSILAAPGTLSVEEPTGISRRLVWQNRNPQSRILEFSFGGVAGFGFDYANLPKKSGCLMLVEAPDGKLNPVPFESSGSKSGFIGVVAGAGPGAVDESAGIHKVTMRCGQEIAIDNLSISSLPLPTAMITTDVFGMNGGGGSWTYSNATNPGLQGTLNTLPDRYVLGDVQSSRTFHAIVPQSLLGLDQVNLSVQGHELAAEATKSMPYLWYPLKVGDQRKASSKVTVRISDLDRVVNGTAHLQVNVLGRDVIDLPFGDGAKVYAYRLRTRLSASGPGFSTTINGYNWFVPYLGYVASGVKPAPDKRVTLSDFTLQNGSITPTSDADSDGLPDWQEWVAKGTDWQSADTDLDGISDAQDVCPLVADAKQTDDDGDAVGNSCEATRIGNVKTGVLIDSAAAADDKLTAKLVGCDGLGDALFTRHYTSLPNPAADLIVTVGEARFETSALGNQDNSPLTVTAADNSQMTVNLLTDSNVITLSGSNTTLDPIANPIKLRVEIGGWACESSATWKAKTRNQRTRYVAPRRTP